MAETVCSSDSLDQEQNTSHFKSQSTINVKDFSCCYTDDDILANSSSQWDTQSTGVVHEKQDLEYSEKLVRTIYSTIYVCQQSKPGKE